MKRGTRLAQLFHACDGTNLHSDFVREVGYIVYGHGHRRHVGVDYAGRVDHEPDMSFPKYEIAAAKCAAGQILSSQQSPGRRPHGWLIVGNVVGYEVGKLAQVDRSGNGSLNQDVALVVRVSFAFEHAQLTECVECACYCWLGYAQLLCQSTHGMRRRREVDGQENCHLARRKVGSVTPHGIENNAMPKRKRLKRFKLYFTLPVA